jgi:HAE1 family hydrophobic/amphiphilic exporter-1
MTFQTEMGEEIPLATLATARMAKGVGEIHREEGKTVLRITATTTKDNLNDLFGQVDRVMTGFEPPRGYRWDKGERFSRAEESNRAQQFAIILAITFVFLLMGILFESFILPLSVLLAIPFAFFGLYWILYLTGTPFDIMAGIGLIILIGVVVNNAIVLIDFVNRLRADGVDRFTALLEGGKHRFRPILMTTGTTVLGLVPMAVGHASLIGIPYAPLGRTMIGGLIASTMLTLIVVPLFYTFFDDLRTWWKQEGENRTLI